MALRMTRYENLAFFLFPPSHFCLALYALGIVVREPRQLARIYFVLHTAAVLGIWIWVFSTRDGLEQYIRASFLVYLDFPLLPLNAVLIELRGALVISSFLLGGALWASVGWFVARVRWRGKLPDDAPKQLDSGKITQRAPPPPDNVLELAKQRFSNP